MMVTSGSRTGRAAKLQAISKVRFQTGEDSEGVTQRSVWAEEEYTFMAVLAVGADGGED
jgi:hypothetical protein